MCCYQVEQLGSLMDGKTTISQLWNSPKAKEIRQETLKGNLHRVCRSWNTCPYLNQPKVPYEFDANPTYPTWLEIDLPNFACNIGGEQPSEENPACIMCCRNYDFKPQPDITQFLCEKAKEIMPYLNRLCILGIAEPFWKDNIFKVMDWLEFDAFADRIQVETNTNGTCIFPKVAERFFERVKYSDISFSLDAATASTFQKIRRLSTFEKICQNLRDYNDLRQKAGGKHRAIVYNNINLLNVDEMEAMVELAFDAGADAILMIPTHDMSGRVKLGELLITEKNKGIFAKNADLAWKRAEQLGFPIIFPKAFDKPDPPLVQLAF